MISSSRLLFGILFLLASLFSILTLPDAYGAADSIEWRQGGIGTSAAPVNSGDEFGNSQPVTVFIHDHSLESNGNSNELITVTITSTVDSTGITVQLTETGDTGNFASGKVILMHGSDISEITDTVTISIEDGTCAGSCNTGAPDILSSASFEGVTIFSTTDTSTGVALDLTETGDDTRIFTATLNFATSGPSSGNTLHVSAGDTISIFDDVDSEIINALIAPSGTVNFGAISAVPASVETIPTTTYFVTAAYDGSSSILEVQNDGAGGRGSGGLIRPGLVVDSVSDPSPTNTDSGSGSGCSGDCTPPTVGIDSKSLRIVENGFSFNDNPVNAELYYTPYPLVTVNVGQQNKVELKIYDGGGIANIAHVGLGFGLGNGESFDKSRATINLDMTRDGQNILSTEDPENVLENVAIITEKTSCNSSDSIQCLKVMIFHTFRAPLEFNMLATYIWDHSKNAWQNYYNHGIHIDGDSLNPPKEYLGIHKGHIIHIFEIGKNTAIDSDGNTWTFDKTWKMDYVPLKKRIDGITQHGIDRHNAWFESYKEGQGLLAEAKLNMMLTGKDIDNNSNYVPKTHYGDFYSASENTQLQYDIKFQKLKAKYIFSQLYDVRQNFQK
ncbi:hypothetical protein [Nitrosopumilus adriaticus]|uniref:hypothetical protein n=1 Tax=Nitrosopumilus adriaticus TaxID=1580092 RepID=UPI00352EEA66